MRKGAINLSINMIIVLIIAIIILGFALSFITSMFRQAETTLEGQFPEPEVTVNRDNPIGIGSQLLIRDGEERRMSLKVLNTKCGPMVTAAALPNQVITNPRVSCQGPAPVIQQVEGPVTINGGEVKNIKIVFKGAPAMTNNDICTITFDTQPASVGGAPCFAAQITQSFFLNTK